MCQFTVALHVLLIPLSLHVSPGDNPKLAELMDKFAQTRDTFQSCIIEHEDSYEEKNVVTMPQYRNTSGRHTKKEVSEFRYDGERMFHHSKRWGRFGGQNLSQDRPYYRSRLCDGHRTYDHSQVYNGTKPDLIHVSRKGGTVQDNYTAFQYYSGHALVGWFNGNEKPMDVILRQAEDVTVRPETERVNGSNCYVIEANTDWGKYKIWIDPEHGYHIAKLEAHKSGDDLWRGKPISETYVNKFTDVRVKSTSFSISDVQFKKVGDTWVPVEAVLETTHRFSNGDSLHQKQHHKCTKVLLDPDHDALKSFVPDFPNGSTVKIRGVRGVTYKWQDGDFVPNISEEQLGSITDEITKTVPEVKKHRNSTGPGAAAHSTRTAVEAGSNGHGREPNLLGTQSAAAYLYVSLALALIVMGLVVGFVIIVRSRRLRTQ